MIDKLVGTKERTLPTDLNRYEFDRIYRYVVEKYGSHSKSVLDYGCGSGYGTAYMCKYFAKVTGIDVSKEAIEACEVNYNLPNLNFKIFDPMNQPFHDESFEFIGSFQVFEHIPLDGIENFIRYVWNMLRKGGAAVVTTPNAKNYFGGHSGNPFHIKEYRREELQEVFASQISAEHFRVFVTSDVPSTALRNRIKRTFRASKFGSSVGSLVSKPIALAERKGLVSIPVSPIVKNGNDDVMGGFLVEINKPV